MTTKLKVDFSGVYKKFGVTNIQLGKRAMANQILADNNLYVPRRENDLRNSGRIEKDGSEIVWDTLYAYRMFTAPKSWNYTTAGTGPHWDEKAKSIHEKQWVEVFKKGAKF